jgi:hypothetical protein
MGVAIVYLLERGVGPIVEREHRHDERDGDRHGVATTRFGRLLRGHGRSTRPPEPFAPGTPGLSAAAIFAHAGEVNLRISAAVSASQPPAVDTAVLGALLGLAARGRCALLLRTTRNWSVTRPKQRRRAEALTWSVRRVEGGREQAMDEGWVESALLAALDALAADGAPSPAPAAGPYRSAVITPSASGIDGAAVPVPALIQALTRGHDPPRGWLKGVLRGEARRWARATRDAEVGAALGAELASLFRDRTTRARVCALFAQVRAGLAGGERKAG